MIKRYVKLPGFRNSAQAPLSLKVKGSGEAFEKHPDFVAQVLMAWSELLPDLRQQGNIKQGFHLLDRLL